MKPFLFEVMQEIIGDAKCEFIGEIGTHKGGTAQQFINLCAPRVKKLIYYGYDVFDADNPDSALHKRERNGKAPASYNVATATLNKLKKIHPNLEYKLHKGFTNDTLKPTVFDFVYIDGGHSYETVKHDYSMVKDSKIIVFDDVKIRGVNQNVKELQEQGISIELVKTDSKHTWAVIRN
jgi:hypothetical protein